jgi:hypothetical protein
MAIHVREAVAEALHNVDASLNWLICSCASACCSVGTSVRAQSTLSFVHLLIQAAVPLDAGTSSMS